MDGTLRLIIPPVTEPVAIDILRQHVRLMEDYDDALLSLYQQAAVENIEAETQRCLMPQTWELRLDRWPDSRDHCAGSIMIPHAPLIAVDSVVVVHEDGTAQTISPASYAIDAPYGPICGRARISPGSGGWPDVSGAVHAPIRITYRAGYSGGNPLPAALQAAVLLAVGSLYENREAEAEKSGSGARVLAGNPAYQRLLQPYRILN